MRKDHTQLSQNWGKLLLLLLNLTEYMCSTCTVQIPLIYCPYVWAVTCKIKCSLLNITFQFLNVPDRAFCAFTNNFKIYNSSLSSIWVQLSGNKKGQRSDQGAGGQSWDTGPGNAHCTTTEGWGSRVPTACNQKLD